MESATGMEKQAAAITASDTTWSQISSGSNNRQMMCGDNAEESSNRSKKPSMPSPQIQPDNRNARVESQIQGKRVQDWPDSKWNFQRRKADAIGFVKSSSETISAG